MLVVNRIALRFRRRTQTLTQAHLYLSKCSLNFLHPAFALVNSQEPKQILVTFFREQNEKAKQTATFYRFFETIETVQKRTMFYTKVYGQEWRQVLVSLNFSLSEVKNYRHINDSKQQQKQTKPLLIELENIGDKFKKSVINDFLHTQKIVFLV